MNVQKIIAIARRRNLSVDDIYLVLAIFESGAEDSVYFTRGKPAESVELVMKIIAESFMKYLKEYIKFEERTDIELLKIIAGRREINIPFERLEKVYNDIKEQGDENYEFTTLRRTNKKI